MEIQTNGPVDAPSAVIDSENHDFFCISSNWELVGNNKRLRDTISSVSVKSASSSMSLEDIVNETTCVELKPQSENVSSCSVEIKLKDGKRIVKMGIVSEARILEIFKEFGEYEKTIHAEFIDEFEGQIVNFAEITFNQPTVETNIQFTKMKKNDRSTMFLYGIRLILENSLPSKSPETLDLNLISDLFGILRRDRQRDQRKLPEMPPPVDSFNANNMGDSFKLSLASELGRNNNSSPVNPDNHNAMTIEKTIAESSIDTKIKMMEQRLMQRIDDSEARISRKLDEILKKLESITT